MQKVTLILLDVQIINSSLIEFLDATNGVCRLRTKPKTLLVVTYSFSLKIINNSFGLANDGVHDGNSFGLANDGVHDEE